MSCKIFLESNNMPLVHYEVATEFRGLTVHPRFIFLIFLKVFGLSLITRSADARAVRHVLCHYDRRYQYLPN